jgi:hypothetical protein
MNNLHTYFIFGGINMDTQMIMNQMELDFESLAKEHEVAASNERLWAKGSSYPHIIAMHEENAAGHLLLARMYRRMKEDCLAFVETYDDDAER